ncbi:DEAD/DEAH box helicase family protein [Ornithinibacillus halophilus]|uniref:Superfamily II DNA or RNA helicase n=1 Tax=Ornithinibacillus halophilus TaxID=930117 RepID=A0A1M5KTS1_9BACI|nr:DEAD/DEAH box helicase family protein [Ornithinibacillus halophilus]SHG56168.1 Superfamily II DNA or RNA helicase [Ornithinibacillus halophilus]
MEDITLYTNNLHKQIKEDIRQSSTIYILSSFIMKSGVDVIFDSLQDALKQGADIKILTGDYLYVTQPNALVRLLELEGDNIEIRLWRSNGIAFHPKTYIFKHREEGAIIVGSSNLSRSAFTSGVEWNLRMQRRASQHTFDEAIDLFIESFYDDQTIAINAETLKRYQNDYNQFRAKNTDLMATWTKREEIELTLPTDEQESSNQVQDSFKTYETKLEPRQAQNEALEELHSTIEEDYNKAMVVMATGLGKTYLAAFFAKRFKKILFIAHREEILKQAKKSFEQVLHKKGGLYYASEKNKNHDMLFASIFTLSIQDHLHQFDLNEFDLIVVDEFHHAAAKSYTKVIDYFNPEFLLGLTATPERTDGQDVFAICDGNVAYEITFIEAIQRGWLTPFSYYGIKDDIDYSQIRWLGNKYDQHELTLQQLQTDRASKIYDKWTQYKQSRTLAFCSSIQQAEFLANYFTNKGALAITLTSKTKDISRAEAIRMLESGEIEIIFTVDLFNEGVDIPSVDTLLFARPTESLVVFTQQIGRGLRKFAGKETCVIIDLIGNYRHADTKLQVFADKENPDKPKSTRNPVPIVPEVCDIHFETEVIDLLNELQKKRSSRKERLFHDYLAVKENLGRRPTYKEAHLYGNINSKEYLQAFGGYFSFLQEYGELSIHEKEVYQSYYQWLAKVEKEQMSKSYKMVVLQYLLEKGPEDWFKPVTPIDIAPFFHKFYMEKEYRKQIDFSNKNTKKLWDYNEKGIIKLLSDMPLSKWVGKDDLVFFDGDQFGMNFEVDKEDQESLYKMTQQISEYKLHVYFERKGVKEKSRLI